MRLKTEKIPQIKNSDLVDGCRCSESQIKIISPRYKQRSWAGRVAQVVEYLSSKHKALASISSTAKQKQNKKQTKRTKQVFSVNPS
jgi:hypothetical protein